jgi:hypothetical protein
MRSSRRFDATSSRRSPPRSRSPASNWHSSGVKVFSKRMLPHQVMLSLSSMSRFASARSPKAARLVDQVEARLAGFGDQRADALS